MLFCRLAKNSDRDVRNAISRKRVREVLGSDARREARKTLRRGMRDKIFTIVAIVLVPILTMVFVYMY